MRRLNDLSEADAGSLLWGVDAVFELLHDGFDSSTFPRHSLSVCVALCVINQSKESEKGDFLEGVNGGIGVALRDQLIKVS